MIPEFQHPCLMMTRKALTSAAARQRSRVRAPSSPPLNKRFSGMCDKSLRALKRHSAPRLGQAAVFQIRTDDLFHAIRGARYALATRRVSEWVVNTCRITIYGAAVI